MVQYFPVITGSLTVTGSVNISGSITATGGVTISGSIASASYAANAERLDNLDSTSFVFTSSYNQDSSSFSTRTTNLETASGSFSTRVTTIESKYATTGSNIFLANQTICGNLTTTGTITAQTINVQQVTSSIVYSSGSNIFGNQITDTQQFTGSMFITGSTLNINGGTICATGNACFGNDVYVYGDLRMAGTDSYIWSPSLSSTGYTGFYDGYNNSTPLKVCNTNGHLILQVEKCNVGVGVSNPGQKLEVAGVIHSFDRTNGAVDGQLWASKSGGTTSVIIRSCGNTYFNGGNVGIGTDNPTKKLQICTTGTAENVLTITNGTQNLQLGVNNGASGSYLFEQSSNGLRFGTADVERMRFTDTGIACFACQVCAPQLQIKPVNDGGIVITRPSDSTVNHLRISTTETGGDAYTVRYNTFNNEMLFTTYAGGGTGGNIIFRTTCVGAGSETERFRINCHGIATFTCQVCAPRVILGGTTPLTYYCEGSWTPTVIGSSSNPTVSYSNRQGTFTRIGNLVTAFFDLQMSSISGGSGNAYVSGLPFTVNSNMAGYSVAQWRDAAAVQAIGGTVLKGFAERGQSYIYMQYDFTGACGFATCNAVSISNLLASRLTGYVIYQA